MTIKNPPRVKDYSTLRDHAKEIAQLAATTGVVISCQGSWIEPVYKKLLPNIPKSKAEYPSLELLQQECHGYIEMLEIPQDKKSLAKKSCPTVFVVSDEAKLFPNDPRFQLNEFVAVLTNFELCGPVIWLPRKFLG